MSKFKIKQIYILLFIFASCASTQILTKNQAIEKAESFVIEQGYSDKKINLNRVKIEHNILDQYQTLENVVELRRNLLNSKSVYVKQIKNGWIIGFKYKNEKFNEIRDGIRFGKGVWVSESGNEIKMIHENIGFD